MITKQCTKCGEHKELTEFSKHKKCKHGVNSACRSCRNRQEKDRYIQHGRRSGSTYTYERQIRYRYNLTMDEYNDLLNNQLGMCAICGSKDKLVVDHDHMTNKVRGILCSRCNIGLGKFKDSPALLERAKQYLE